MQTAPFQDFLFQQIAERDSCSLAHSQSSKRVRAHESASLLQDQQKKLIQEQKGSLKAAAQAGSVQDRRSKKDSPLIVHSAGTVMQAAAEEHRATEQQQMNERKKKYLQSEPGPGKMLATKMWCKGRYRPRPVRYRLELEGQMRAKQTPLQSMEDPVWF